MDPESPIPENDIISSCPGHIPRQQDKYAQNQKCNFCEATRRYVCPPTKDGPIYDIDKCGYTAWK